MKKIYFIDKYIGQQTQIRWGERKVFQKCKTVQEQSQKFISDFITE